MDVTLRFPDQLSMQIKALRKLRGLSQAELGRRIGVGQPRMADIEASPGQVSTEQLLQVFQALGAELVLRVADTAMETVGREPAPAQPPRAAEPPARFGSRPPRPVPVAPQAPARKPNKGSW